jgi:hypothetical protein
MYRESPQFDFAFVANLSFLSVVVVDEASKEGAVVDPYDWQKMLNFVKEKGVNVSEPRIR